MAAKKDVPGALLINAIYREIGERGLTQKDAASLLGISKPYLTALLTGTRPLDGLGKDKVSAIARFLNVPAMQVRVMAETFPVEDFFSETSLGEELDRMHERMLADNIWCTHAPHESAWKQMPLEQKRLVGLLYEKVMHEEFLTKASPLQFERQT